MCVFSLKMRLGLRIIYVLRSTWSVEDGEFALHALIVEGADDLSYSVFACLRGDRDARRDCGEIITQLERSFPL